MTQEQGDSAIPAYAPNNNQFPFSPCLRFSKAHTKLRGRAFSRKERAILELSQ